VEKKGKRAVGKRAKRSRERVEQYELSLTQYGFRWGDVLVERTASNGVNPKFQVITVQAPNRERVRITMRPREVTAVKLEKAKE
jgi:hypothetical protein